MLKSPLYIVHLRRCAVTDPVKQAVTLESHPTTLASLPSTTRIRKAYSPSFSAICRLLPHKVADPLMHYNEVTHAHTATLCGDTLTVNLVERMSLEHDIE